MEPSAFSMNQVCLYSLNYAVAWCVHLSLLFEGIGMRENMVVAKNTPHGSYDPSTQGRFTRLVSLRGLLEFEG